MKKRFFFYALAGAVIILLFFAGCGTTQTDRPAGGSIGSEKSGPAGGPVDVVMGWIEAVKAEDPGKYIDSYWPEAEKIVMLGGEKTELFGRQEILEHQQQIWYRLDLESLSYEKPKVRNHKLPDRTVVFLVDRSQSFTDTFLLWKRNGIWKIEHHILKEIPNSKVKSDFQRWADTNGNGELEDAELKQLLRAGSALILGVHENKTPLDDIFDFDENGRIDEREVRITRLYFFNIGLKELMKDAGAERVKEWFDINGDGSVDDAEKKMLVRFLISFNYLRLREREVQNRLDRWMDENGDSVVTKDEQIESFQNIFERILLLPHDTERIRRAAKEQLENGYDEQAVGEEAFIEKKTAASEIEGKRVAVVGLESMTGAVTDETVDGLLLFIENAFVNSGRVVVVDRKNIDSIVEEYEFQRSAMTDESTAVEIGKMANAELIVTGAVTSVGGRYYLNIRLIEVESGEIAGSTLSAADEEDGFLEMCGTAVSALFSD